MTSNGTGNNGYTVPQPRADWIARRKRENTTGNFSQMHYARQGVITEEMALHRPQGKAHAASSSATKSPAAA